MQSINSFRTWLFCVLTFALILTFPNQGKAVVVDTLLVDSMLIETRLLRELDPESGILLADSALTLSREIGYFRGRINSQVRLGELNMWIGKYAIAHEYLDSAMVLVKAANIQRGVAAIHYQYGSYYRRTGDYVKSLELIQAGYHIYDSLGNREGMAVGLQTLAILHKVQGDTAAAIDSYKRARNLFQKMGHQRGIIASNINLSLIFLDQNKLDSAIIYQNIALSIARKHNLKRGEALALTNRGSTHLKLKKYPEALADLEHSESFFRDSKDYFRLAACKVLRTRLHIELKEYHLAQSSLEEGVKLARELESQDIEMALFTLQARMYEEQGRYKEALEAERIVQILGQSLTNEKVRKSLDSMRVKAELERKERELADMAMQLQTEKLETQRKDLEVEKQELQLNKSRIRTGLLVGILVFLVIIGGFVLMKYFDNQRHQNLLVEKQEVTQLALEEKEMLLGEIHHRVKNNLQLVYNLLDLQRRSLPDPAGAKALQESMNRISSMSLVHEKLYGEEHVGRIPMDEYLTQLIDRITKSYNLSPDRVRVHQQVDAIVLDTKMVIPLGIIVTELLTNAAKYAFPENLSGNIWLELKNAGKHLIFEIRDDGTGCQLEKLKSGKGFGLRIVRSLSRQLKAELQFSTHKGVAIQMQINYPNG